MKYDLPKETIKNKFVDFLRHINIKFQIIRQKYLMKYENIADIKNYWSNPYDKGNKPIMYTKEGFERSDLLVQYASKLGIKEPKILEVGCNAGRNLNCFYSKGFKDLTAVEINKEAIKVLKKTYPHLEERTEFLIGSADEMLTKLQDNKFDIVYSMAVLQHIHPDSINKVVEEMYRVTKSYLIIREAESYATWKHFPRSYKKLFTKLGAKHLGRFNTFRLFKKVN